ncbi:DUF4232 domain-containing protein [Micromonospora sp. M12]
MRIDGWSPRHGSTATDQRDGRDGSRARRLRFRRPSGPGRGPDWPSTDRAQHGSEPVRQHYGAGRVPGVRRADQVDRRRRRDGPARPRLGAGQLRRPPYQLNGYPVLHVFDEQREPIMLRVVNGAKEITMGFDQPPRQVTLAAGERATAVVLWRNLVTDSTVVATNGEFLTVAPAAGQPDHEVDPDGPIDLGNTGRIGVSAWKKADPSTPVPTRPARRRRRARRRHR